MSIYKLGNDQPNIDASAWVAAEGSDEQPTATALQTAADTNRPIFIDTSRTLASSTFGHRRDEMSVDTRPGQRR